MQERYLALAYAREVLSQALSFEQRYELLLGNFHLVGNGLHRNFTSRNAGAAIRILRLGGNPGASEPARGECLTAMRGYADQVSQDFKSLETELRFGSIAKAELTRLFDRSPSYRFVCALHNHVQAQASHRRIRRDANRKGDANAWIDSVRLYANRSTLKVDKDFKMRTLDEQPEKTDFRRVVRQSMREMGDAHLAMRDATAAHVEAARGTIDAAIRDYKAAGAESAIALGARRIGSADADVPVMLDWDDVRLQLVRKNASAPSLL